MSEEHRADLQALTRSRHGSPALVRRAPCFLLWSAGERHVDIGDKLACNAEFITRWTWAYAGQRLPWRVPFLPGCAARQPVEKLSARALDYTPKRGPRDGSTHWSSRKLAAGLGDISFMAVQRIWQKHGERPHRPRQHMIPTIPISRPRRLM